MPISTRTFKPTGKKFLGSLLSGSDLQRNQYIVFRSIWEFQQVETQRSTKYYPVRDIVVPTFNNTD